MNVWKLKRISSDHRRVAVLVEILSLLLLYSQAAQAIPVTITYAAQNREVQNRPPDAYTGGGNTIFDTLEIDVLVFSGATPLITGVTVNAVNSADPGTVVPLRPYDDPIYSVPGWYTEMGYDPMLAAGTWTITALTTDGMSDTAMAGPNSAPALDLPSDINIAGPLLTPTLTWTLPPGSFDRVTFDIVDNNEPSLYAGLGLVIFRTFLPEDTTAFTVPPGALPGPGEYTFRVRVDRFAVPGTTEGFTKASRFVLYTIPVPEPSTLLLLSLGFAGLGFVWKRS